mmetsp:Transcript_22824/g.54623  ORF Transcript_22824/g.54623 Transcript_22824/m.54623 type:complete len:212 (+) Transcript_22824:1734-2369(+)
MIFQGLLIEDLQGRFPHGMAPVSTMNASALCSCFVRRGSSKLLLMGRRGVACFTRLRTPGRPGIRQIPGEEHGSLRGDEVCEDSRMDTWLAVWQRWALSGSQLCPDWRRQGEPPTSLSAWASALLATASLSTRSPLRWRSRETVGASQTGAGPAGRAAGSPSGTAPALRRPSPRAARRCRRRPASRGSRPRPPRTSARAAGAARPALSRGG